MLHKIVGVRERYSLKPSEKGSHRIGREVHVGNLSLLQPVMFYHSSGVTVTSPVVKWVEKLDGYMEIFTENTIYQLEAIKN